MKLINIAINNPKFGKHLRYILTGGSSVLLDIGVFSLLTVASEGDHTLLFQSISTVIALAYNYLLNYKWVFKHNLIEKRPTASLSKYLLASLINYVISSSLLLLLAEAVFDIGAKIIAMSLMVVWNFFLYERFIFKSK